MAKTTRRSSMTIDVHTHIRIPAVEEFARKNPAKGGGPGKVDWVSKESAAFQKSSQKKARPKFVNPKVRLRDMDRMGVDMQVISLNLPQNCYWADGAKGLEVARACNDGIAEFIAAKPDRFIGMGSVGLQDVGRSMRELGRAVNSLGLKGVVVSSNIRNRDLGETRFKPFWAKAQELGVPVFIHPQGFSHADRLAKFFLWNSVGQPLEEALAMSSLIHEGVMDEFPKLKLCIDHGGGYLPFYAGRTDRAFERRPETSLNIKKKPSAYLRQFYYDTVFYDLDMLAFLVKKVGAGRIMMGTDYPLSMGEDDPVGFVKRTRGLSKDDKDKILWKNAARLFGL